ncbi:hypothetical protein V5799_005479 [Amblyomma americanum]|uniref:Reverse transcriptase domain-containing protein n=1 Tax=Amblyomma americanum TaxID=6943 RepID=A0AAQ4DZ48_AMBAM
MSLNNYLRDHFFKNKGQRKKKTKPTAPKRKEGRRRRRRREFALVQERFYKDQANCAREILGGVRTHDIKDEEKFLEEWTAILERPSGEKVEIPRTGERGLDPFTVVTAQEVKVSMLLARTAAGPDGFGGRDLRAVPLVVLQVVLNLLMLLRHILVCLRNARTIFVPKVACASAATEFRPITIAPAIVRIFHKILASRILAQVALDHRQRAFIPVDECGENTMLLASALHEAKCKWRPLYIPTLDIAKAFDAVQLSAILRGLAINGYNNILLNYIEEFYTTAQTLLPI